MLNTEREVKALAKGLRRELKASGAQAAALSHTRMLELLARALGQPSYAALQAALASSAVAAGSNAARILRAPPYPLVNTGQFDFVRSGEVRTGLFAPLRGTLENIPGTALVARVERDAQKAGRLVPHYEGDTEVYWDGSEPCRNEYGLALWETDTFEQVSEGQLIVVPAGFHPDDTTLAVRQALVDAYVTYVRRQRRPVGALVAELQRALRPDSAQADTPLLDEVAAALGFALVRTERQALQHALTHR